MPQIEHEQLYAPVDMKLKASLKQPWTLVFTDKDGHKMDFLFRDAVARLPERFIKNPAKRRELTDGLFESYFKNKEKMPLEAHFSGVAGFGRKILYRTLDLVRHQPR